MLLNQPHPVLPREASSQLATAPASKLPSASSRQDQQPARSALEAYNRGHFEEAEQAAAPVAERARKSPDPVVRKQGARARWVMAFAAARRKDFPVARQRFAQLREEAAALPDHGKQGGRLGENPPTLEEEAAYEHAVMTSALARQAAVGSGSRQEQTEDSGSAEISQAAAEREFLQFIHDHPESPLLHAAILRVGRMHGGNIPKEAEAVWKEARGKALAAQAERERQQSLCAPEALAEVLKRAAVEHAQSEQPATVEALASEMKTDRQGTTLKALAATAQAHGFKVEALHLSAKGLRQQFNPASPGGRARYVIALVNPGHFVLVEDARFTTVRIWDPDQDGAGHGGVRELSTEAWQRQWSGAALVLR